MKKWLNQVKKIVEKSVVLMKYIPLKPFVMKATMQSIFHLHTSELDASFLDALKSLFRDTEITVTVKAASNGHSHDDDAKESAIDETEFLLSHPANRARLLEAINNADAGNLIAVDVEKILAGVHPSEAIITPQTVAA